MFLLGKYQKRNRYDVIISCRKESSKKIVKEKSYSERNGENSAVIREFTTKTGFRTMSGNRWRNVSPTRSLLQRTSLQDCNLRSALSFCV